VLGSHACENEIKVQSIAVVAGYGGFRRWKVLSFATHGKCLQGLATQLRQRGLKLWIGDRPVRIGI
jgi:hypothetical protein